MDDLIPNHALKEDRHRAILELLSKHKSLRISQLKEMFGVSEVTLRSDLSQLEDQGLVIRVHGGVRLPKLNETIEVPYSQRAIENKQQKINIGKAAAKMVNDGDIIILDSGTTTMQVARHLKDHKGVTVVTNSLNVASVLGVNPNLIVHLTGGILNYATLSLVGPEAERSISDIKADKLFLAAHAVDNGHLMERGILMAQVKRAMIQSAREVILVADSSKFGKISFTIVTDLHSVDIIITDSNLEARMQDELRGFGLKLVLV
ncbi:MAG: DeoR/GlpR transcriptional regulator [Syntrophothermus sp.]|uniref:DeoR/GlpR family DNA-binding transcription regulator n=1 Tax=Syntrophothermus sp. TaxID=2736299 RepID=UPI00257B2B33|nr:DeoR/GlpR family DNA-binding transcription regulator [Syntrophothermus sp.]NSW83170.1 DeoR/GlpR transcriptional regulator [Syntrophothermus sp.]